MFDAEEQIMMILLLCCCVSKIIIDERVVVKKNSAVPIRFKYVIKINPANNKQMIENMLMGIKLKSKKSSSLKEDPQDYSRFIDKYLNNDYVKFIMINMVRNRGQGVVSIGPLAV